MNPIVFLTSFSGFVSTAKNGRNCASTGKRFAPGTVQQYSIVYHYLISFQQTLKSPLRIQLLQKRNQRIFLQESNYWKRIKIDLENFLRRRYHCTDSYIASVFKIIRTFFNYLKKEKGLPVGHFYQCFRLPVYQYTPVLLDIEKLRFLMEDQSWHTNLKKHLAASLDLFLLGCMIGLRYDDLINLKKSNIIQRDSNQYLQVCTRKTGSQVTLLLPDYALEIIQRLRRKTGVYLFNRLSNVNFNIHLKLIMEKAGFTEPAPKFRHVQGRLIEMKTKNGKSYRFCDRVTSHTMRRTAITNLLVLGVPEMVVRKLSGHAPGSKEFYRYVSLAQDFSDKHISAAYDKLLGG